MKNNVKVCMLSCVLLASVSNLPILGISSVEEGERRDIHIPFSSPVSAAQAEESMKNLSNLTRLSQHTSDASASRAQQADEDQTLHRRIESILESLKTRKLSSYDTLHVNLLLDIAAMNIKELGSSEQNSALLKKIHIACNQLSLRSRVDDLESFINKPE